MRAGSKNWHLFLIAASLSLVAVFAIFDSFGADSFVFRKEVRKGGEIISKVDAFRRQRGVFLFRWMKAESALQMRTDSSTRSVASAAFSFGLEPGW